MVRDLEAQKPIYRGQRFPVRGADSNAAASVHLFKSVGDLCLEALQYRNARRNAAVDEHGRVEVAGLEHTCDRCLRICARLSTSPRSLAVTSIAPPSGNNRK